MAKKIKVKGKCPICGNKMIWGSNEYYEEPWTREYLPICTNNDCDLSVGYGSDIKFRFINHRTVKIVYDEGYRRELIIVETDNIGQNIHHAYKAVLSSNRESSVQQFLSKYIEGLKEPESDNDKLLILDSAPKFIKGTHTEVRFNELMKDCIEDITDKKQFIIY